MVLGIGEGRVDLVLDKTSYRPGEAIKGRISLFLNQPEQARALRVEFYGEIEKYNGTSRSIQKICQAQKDVSGEKSYASGEAYDFEIAVPLDAVQPQKSGIIMSLFSIFTPIPKWYVQACLDMPMKLDMNRKVRIQILPPPAPIMQ